MKIKKITPYLILVILILAFFIGVSWQKLVSLEKLLPKPTPAQQQNEAKGPKLTVADLEVYATKIGLDEVKFKKCLDEKKYEAKVMGDLAYGQELGVSGTPGFFINGHFIDGLITYQELSRVLEFELGGGDWNKAPKDVQIIATSAKVDVDISDSQTKGSKDAKVTLVEFSDFECPYCAQFFAYSEPQFIKNYVDAGKVFFVYKHYPLNLGHPHAQKAAEASECAGDQGKFWEMHNIMFESHGY